MKKQIRYGVFETNSSSVHSITMCSQDEYSRWENGELLFDKWDKKFVENTEENKNKYECITEEQFWDDCNFETFYDTYITSSGEKVIAFGYYGEDY